MADQLLGKEYIRDFFRIEEEDDTEVLDIQGRFERVVYEHGQNIISIFEEPDYMYFLESGLAGVYSKDNKQINLMRRGIFFGEYGVLTGEKRLSTVRAEGKVVVHRIKKEDVMEIMTRHPALFSETMKRLYGQISNKHERLLELSNNSRGILHDPKNRTPLTLKQMLMQYGILAIIFVILAFIVPSDATTAPVFIIPLALMVVYAIATRRTMESLIVSGFLAAMFLSKMHLISQYTDSIMATMGDMGNIFTVLVMALMGGFVALIEASGSLTAFKKLMTAKVQNKKSALLGSFGVLLITAVDDCLNLLCASTSMRTALDKNKVSREESSLLMSFLPVVLCSFIPVSLWGIYVVANINTGNNGEEFLLFCKSIPFNFYSIIAAIAMLALCFGKLPRTKALAGGIKRIENGGTLYPEGSLAYLHKDEDSMHGKIRNLMLPIIVLAASSLATSRFVSSNFSINSACGLITTLVFMFFLFCGQSLMSPEQFMDHLMSGMQSMVQPIALYLVTMCFSSLLTQLQLEYYFDEVSIELSNFTGILPAVIFLSAMLLTTLLGSSWAMFVLGFPLAIRLCTTLGLNLPLCLGAVSAAGIAGENNCVLTSNAVVIATALGINPSVVLKLRLKYSVAFSIIAFAFYLVAGMLI
ncbi:MAG: cyclic nucleotide-binding domain-containing protein [Clostridia bacterium]|nr:cyclic nucleotide-binding domain-containing protein [Clostridia bacterium]